MISFIELIVQKDIESNTLNLKPVFQNNIELIV